MNPEQAGPVLAGDHDGDRPLEHGVGHVDAPHRLPGGVADVRGVQQHGRLDPLLGHRRLQAGVALAAHPPRVDRGRGQAVIGQQAAERRVQHV